ncbi:Ohr family peroxiredoxin [Cupriavidus sp. RAF12]|uniref:Ohr family peroxiredoxin n=1 Tax=Cupriavidus sp. RAF12 TaxID=3233050 RepID=UPI003F935726
MSKIQKVLFTGKTHTTASRQDGASHEQLDIHLTTPGNANSPEYSFDAVQSHPTAEQLFAGAWSACYTAAVGLAAKSAKVQVPHDAAVDIEVDLGMTGNEYFLQARIQLTLPGVAQDVAEKIAHAADEMCPYSKATRGNIDVALSVRT